MKKTYHLVVSETDVRGRVRFARLSKDLPAAQAQDGIPSLVLRFDEPDHGFAPGMTVTVTVEG